MTLPTRMVEKPWGREQLPPPFAAPEGRKIGEIWFEPPPALDQLLAKYIFTSERLSVQVHPSDSQTLAEGLGRQGKEECWLVIDAEPDARLGIGFNAPISGEAIRAAALSGEIVDLLTWHPVRAGDFFYIPAGTVHAIGAGVSLVEIQQNSDITYRLYDYGRPRELHLDAGVAVAVGEPHPASLRRHLPEHGSTRLVEGPYFLLDRVEGRIGGDLAGDYGDEALLVIPRKGQVRVAGNPVAAGECALAPSLAAVDFAADSQTLLARACASSD